MAPAALFSLMSEKHAEKSVSQNLTKCLKSLSHKNCLQKLFTLRRLVFSSVPVPILLLLCTATFLQMEAHLPSCTFCSQVCILCAPVPHPNCSGLVPRGSGWCGPPAVHGCDCGRHQCSVPWALHSSRAASTGERERGWVGASVVEVVG